MWKLGWKRIVTECFFFGLGALCVACVFIAGQEARGQKGTGVRRVSRRAEADIPSGDQYLKQSPGAVAQSLAVGDYGLGSSHVSKLEPYPQPCAEGMRTPFDIWRYAGKGRSSWGSPQLRMPFAEWRELHRVQKPKLMADVRSYMASRYDFSGRTLPGVMMSGGRKGVPAGPVARLSPRTASFEALAALAPEEIKRLDAFPYKPLAHPLQSTAHMLFPKMWVDVHPEHQRIDVDFDIPDPYLPEYPPPLFLTTHKELGDITEGQEITMGNYYEMFDGLLTGEQMEGIKELLRTTPSTWFNQTEHRVTAEASAGVSCMSCHVNGHTNGAIELTPDSRPNEARLRVDTPTMRGNFNLMQLSLKRSVRSLDHFCEVEEYFDGDPGLMQAIGPRGTQRHITNRMGDFCALIDNPPAPKLGPMMRLIPAKATASELRGERLFQGKANCVACHYGPQFADDYMHDLQVERFYKGRPEGPVKTFGLRGIKDSPPYLHDGRCPTLHDVVEFFNVVLELKLTADEKEDLVAYLLCL